LEPPCHLLAPVGFGLEESLFMSEEEKNDRGYVNRYGLPRKHIAGSVENSLKKLDLDYTDLLQIHRFDPDTPVKETMKALHDMVKSGKVRYIGASSMRAHQLLACMAGLSSSLCRTSTMPSTEKKSAGCILRARSLPWEGLSVRPREAKPKARVLYGQPMTDADKKNNKNIEEIAKTRGFSMAAIAIAYVQSKPFISVPILGLNSIKRVDAAIEACEFKLSAEEVKSIDDLYMPRNVIIIGQS
ncbi:hypothetical protein KCU71_g1372, partial [Aureobasidium melanogenum]